MEDDGGTGLALLDGRDGDDSANRGSDWMLMSRIATECGVDHPAYLYGGQNRPSTPFHIGDGALASHL